MKAFRVTLVEPKIALREFNIALRAVEVTLPRSLSPRGRGQGVGAIKRLVPAWSCFISLSSSESYQRANFSNRRRPQGRGLGPARVVACASGLCRGLQENVPQGGHRAAVGRGDQGPDRHGVGEEARARDAGGRGAARRPNAWATLARPPRRPSPRSRSWPRPRTPATRPSRWPRKPWRKSRARRPPRSRHASSMVAVPPGRPFVA